MAESQTHLCMSRLVLVCAVRASDQSLAGLNIFMIGILSAWPCCLVRAVLRRSALQTDLSPPSP